ncbi:MAG: hypothetical protein H6978_06195 [Gammaproteobacteria bacterium]|nr:hypothetical protein [Gammaproteobacteria bacterium]
MQVRDCAFIVFGMSLVFATSTSAHHSTAKFDKEHAIVLSGTVKEFQYTNPHSWLQIYVDGNNGEQVEWGIEGGSPNFLKRRGWTAKSLQPGDKVSTRIYPMRDGQPGGIMIEVTLPDGSVLTDIPPP